MKKTRILMTTLAVATLAVGCGVLAACGDDPETYSVTFDANGGTYAENKTTVKVDTDENGRIAQKPTDPTREGTYTFKGYNTVKAGTGSVITFGSKGYQFKEDTTVYAQWNLEYTLTLNAGEHGKFGEETTKQVTTVNNKLPADVGLTADDGWTFKCWLDENEEEVPADTLFTTENVVLTADWEEVAEEEHSEAGLYTANGTLVQALAWIKPGDTAKQQYGALGVELAPGDVLQFKVDGETLTHNEGTLELWTANCHGVQFNQNAATFTVKQRGGERPFNIYLRKYEDGNPCWVIEMTDGLTDTLVPGGAYLVGGKGWADSSWDISADNYIDPANGLIVNFSDDAEFKITNCLDVAAGVENRGWAYNAPSYYKMAEGYEKGYLNFSSISSSGSGSVLAAGEYTITVEGEGANTKFVFTPDESIQPAPDELVDGGFYLAGKGFTTKDANNQDKSIGYAVIKEFYLDPNAENGLEITFSGTGDATDIQLIKHHAGQQPGWDYKSNSYFAVSVPQGLVDVTADQYITFSAGGNGTVKTAGTYIVTITVTEGTPLVTFAPKGGFEPTPQEPEPEYIIHYYIKGSIYNDNWSMPDPENTYKMTESTTEDGTVYTYTIHIDAGKKFMFYSKKEHPDTHEESKHSAEIKSDKLTEASKAYVGGNGDMEALASGTYTFEYDATTEELTVTFVADATGGDAGNE